MPDIDLGRDITTFAPGVDGPDLDDYFREITGGRAVVESVARSWFDTDGIDIRALVGKGLSQPVEQALRQRLVSAAIEDDRVLACRVAVARSGAGPSAGLRIQAEIDIDGDTTSKFVLSVTAVTAELLFEEG